MMRWEVLIERISGRVVGDRHGAGSFRGRDSSSTAFACAGHILSFGYRTDRPASCGMADWESNAFSDRCSYERVEKTGLAERLWNGS